MHGVLSRAFDGRLIFPPVRSPKRILDCGCGPGDWAAEVAEQFPDAEVSVLFLVPLLCILSRLVPNTDLRANANVDNLSSNIQLFSTKAIYPYRHTELFPRASPSGLRTPEALTMETPFSVANGAAFRFWA